MHSGVQILHYGKEWEERKKDFREKEKNAKGLVSERFVRFGGREMMDEKKRDI